MHVLYVFNVYIYNKGKHKTLEKKTIEFKKWKNAIKNKPAPVNYIA